eukprot:UN30946
MIEETLESLQIFLDLPDLLKMAKEIRSICAEPSEHFDYEFLENEMKEYEKSIIEIIVKTWDGDETTFLELGNDKFRNSVPSVLDYLKNLITSLEKGLMEKTELSRNCLELLNYLKDDVLNKVSLECIKTNHSEYTDFLDNLMTWDDEENPYLFTEKKMKIDEITE